MAYNTTAAPTAQTMACNTGTILAPVSLSYCVPYVTQLVIDHKVWPFLISKGKYTIHDEGKTLLFDVEREKFLELMDPILRDPSGEAIVFMKRKIGIMHDKWAAYCGEDDSESSLLFTMGRTSMFKFLYEVFLPANKSSAPDFTIKYCERKYVKYHAHHKYAVLYRERVIAEVNLEIGLMGKLQYDVKVEPEVDHAFISSLIIIIDTVKDNTCGRLLVMGSMIFLVNFVVNLWLY